MIDPSPHPSRRLRFFASFARWTLRLLLAVWLLLALAWGALHGWIVPRISDWRVQVEQVVSQAIGSPVYIGGLEGVSNGLFPVIKLANVRIVDPQGRNGLLLPSVVATVSVRSMFRLGVEQLYIDTPELDIRHLADGSWQVAGLPPFSAQSENSDNAALDWLLDQPEIVFQRGRVEFTDEQDTAAPVALKDVRLVLRKQHWRHMVRLDAFPVAYEGEHIHVTGIFRQSLLSSAASGFSGWSGQWYASLNLQHLPQLPWKDLWGIQSVQGYGQARAWAEVNKGKLQNATLDVALPEVLLQWEDAHTQDLLVQQVQSRFQLQQQKNGWSVQANDFTFQTDAGAKWPQSDWRVQTTGSLGAPASIEVAFDYVDLAMVSMLSRALPISQKLQQTLQTLGPQGEVLQLQATWSDAESYQVSARVQKLTLQPQPDKQEIGIPGVDGLNADLRFDAKGGKARLDISTGTLYFPGVFEESAIDLDALQADVQWSWAGERLRVEVPKATFENADAQGSLSGFWQMGELSEERFPGFLHLQGTLSRANGARVYRYLPLEIPQQARYYVRDSVRQGNARNVAFEVSGDLKNMPFERPDSGRFWIQAPVTDVVYAFVPLSLHTGTSPAWPALSQVSGTLVFDGSAMHIRQTQARFEPYPQLQLKEIEAKIPDLEQPHLTVHAKGQIDLPAALVLVNHSPLVEMTSGAFDETRSQGMVQLDLSLDLPIEHLERTKVQGKIGFQGNLVQFNAQTPLVHGLRGAVQFSEKGFALQDVRGQSLGGTVQITGGMSSADKGVQIQAYGKAKASGLQSEHMLPWISKLAAYTEGSMGYTVDINSKDARQTVDVRSDLDGLSLDLPIPFHKDADERWPLHVHYARSARGIEQIRTEIAQKAVFHLERDISKNASQLVRGQLIVGNPRVAKALHSGVDVYVDLPALDADAWLKVAQSFSDGDQGESDGSFTQDAPWLPNQIMLKVGQLQLQERIFDDVNVDMSQKAGVWQGQVQAQDFSGRIEYHAPQKQHTQGYLFARLSHLRLPSVQDNLEVEPPEEGQLRNLPALDIEVDALEIAGKSLGQLKLKARNTSSLLGREWTLEQFDLKTPEASWQAKGYWGADVAGQKRATQLSFLLEMESAGQLLERFGMPAVIRNGKGRIHGSIGWQGSPIAPDRPSMHGTLQMDLGKGQFLKVEPGAGKLLSVLSLQSLSRRITLDFRDVFSQGFAFDFIRGNVQMEHGIARTNNLQMNGLNAAVLMEGSADLVNETQALTVVVVPEINAMTASLAAAAINPIVGVGSFLAQVILRKPLMEAATRTFAVSGAWTDPVIEQVPTAAVVQPIESPAP